MMSVCTTFTVFIGVAAAGGGGGGGGGGATRNVINCCFGRASVKTSGRITRIPTRATWKMKETKVVAPRLVLNLPPDSIRLSSNIRFLPTTGPHVRLDTVCEVLAPRAY